jgi:outer membrane receptor for Fe3+-dicitrate
VRHEQTVFQVPNEFVQQASGQRQDRNTDETIGIFSYQHIFSENTLGDFRVMARDDSSGLVSDDQSTPIIAGQQRSFREVYAKGNISIHHGRNEIKAGADLDYGSIRERFNYAITDFSQFDPDTPATFNFYGYGLDREQALYVQDLVRLGRWTLSAGLRWDHYRLVVDHRAFSPRLGIAWYWPRADLVFHASYDRIFQTPAAENILLASSAAVGALNPEVLRLPVEPSHGNFYEAGLTKGLLGKLKLELNYYNRRFDNYADDDVLLNTGVSFPIAFHRGTIYGTEAKLELPNWGRLSGQVSYSNMVGFGYTPVTGGLFLGDDASGALANSGRFPVSQDQRNTLSTRFRYQVVPRAWVAFGASYGSGLPTEFDGTVQEAIRQFGQQIVNRVNFDRGRVKPSLALGASIGTDLIKNEHMVMRLQADAQNLNNRLNVINFAGLFSGTGIAPPRSYALRLGLEF